MEPDQFCWRAGALLTLLTLNPRNSGSGYQLMIPKISYLNQKFALNVITLTFLLNMIVAEMLTIISFISSFVKLAEILL